MNQNRIKQIPVCLVRASFYTSGPPAHHPHPFLDYTKNTDPLSLYHESYESSYTLRTLISQMRNCSIIGQPYGEMEVPMHEEGNFKHHGN